jgi:hypothetical protein
MWTPITRSQALALGRIASKKDAPDTFVMMRQADTDRTMIVVPASQKDARRWDVTKTGKISRKER